MRKALESVIEAFVAVASQANGPEFLTVPEAAVTARHKNTSIIKRWQKDGSLKLYDNGDGHKLVHRMELLAKLTNEHGSKSEGRSAEVRAEEIARKGRK